MTARLERTFLGAWASLTPIGRDDSGGVTRLAWTAEDRGAREWFRTQARDRGLDVRQDNNGMLWAWWGDPGPAAVVTGSHLDSVPGGGAYDGPLGVLAGLCAVELLQERGVRPVRPVAVAVFPDEEGGRFGTACVGSRLITGALPPERARSLVDATGTTLATALADVGVDPTGIGADRDLSTRVGCFVELHIEQGRGLGDLGAAVGVATGIWPHGRWRLSLTGEPDHAGTTRLADRHDPVVALAAAVVAARSAALRFDARATVGRVRVEPGAANAVAARADAWLDARAGDDTVLEAVVEEVVASTRAAGNLERVQVDVVEESRSPAVVFDAGLRDRVAAVVARETGAAPLLPTAAGHDAGILAARVPTAMLFVRNPTGTSHSPSEHAELADCLTGVRVLAAVLEDLACG